MPTPSEQPEPRDIAMEQALPEQVEDLEAESAPEDDPGATGADESGARE